MPQRFSTARGREFGEVVRAAISASGMTAQRVAELVGWQEGKLSDFVNGKIGCTETELALLLGVCRTPAQERDHLLNLLPETQVRGWWQQHGSRVPARLRTLVKNVAAAKTLTMWHPHALPVFLQSVDYMRAAISAAPNVPDEEMDQRVKAAQELQGLVSGRDLRCTFHVHGMYSASVGAGGLIALSRSSAVTPIRSRTRRAASSQPGSVRRSRVLTTWHNGE
ncbi:Scr1 family TA system antitoxin-like transcriptional regulator [Lentzea nigeriaca]|uniref:Scr1 family TA system antitoxin-like transcriptional regulator n=1 Tax=Lentzea nigeriaca TaxID=1128665 RepID=UPI001956702C|nr:Scr1 family TA system antitoxin-like transcriptional regulator [Lentzea nigeriaca]MBM7863654.1 plasmid maintenance system antidote protein VapI [Lentzea nigeriaca]